MSNVNGGAGALVTTVTSVVATGEITSEETSSKKRKFEELTAAPDAPDVANEIVMYNRSGTLYTRTGLAGPETVVGGGGGGGGDLLADGSVPMTGVLRGTTDGVQDLGLAGTRFGTLYANAHIANGITQDLGASAWGRVCYPHDANGPSFNVTTAVLRNHRLTAAYQCVGDQLNVNVTPTSTNIGVVQHGMYRVSFSVMAEADSNNDYAVSVLLNKDRTLYSNENWNFGNDPDTTVVSQYYGQFNGEEVTFYQSMIAVLPSNGNISLWLVRKAGNTYNVQLRVADLHVVRMPYHHIAAGETAPATITYTPAIPALISGSFDSNVPTLGVTGNPAPRWTIRPELPHGLVMDALTGQITGTPVEPIASTLYTVTAFNRNGETTTTFTTQSTGLAATGFTYTTPLNLTVNVAMTTESPVAAPQLPRSFEITAGSLPSGLSLNFVSGDITGTPDTISSGSFTVSGSNWGSPTPATFVVSWMIVAGGVASPNINYPSLPTSFPEETTLTGLGVPTNSGDPIVTWSLLLGTLPAGVSFSTGATPGATGAITGIPTTPGTGSATLRATNTGGNSDFVWGWTVTAPILGFNYGLAGDTLTLPEGHSTYSATPLFSNTPETPVTYAEQPPATFAAAGLSLNTVTGEISSIGVTLQAGLGLTVRATNPQGFVDYAFTLVGYVEVETTGVSIPAVSYTSAAALLPRMTSNTVENPVQVDPNVLPDITVTHSSFFDAFTHGFNTVDQDWVAAQTTGDVPFWNSANVANNLYPGASQPRPYNTLAGRNQTLYWPQGTLPTAQATADGEYLEFSLNGSMVPNIGGFALGPRSDGAFNFGQPYRVLVLVTQTHQAGPASRDVEWFEVADHLVPAYTMADDFKQFVLETGNFPAAVTGIRIVILSTHSTGTVNTVQLGTVQFFTA